MLVGPVLIEKNALSNVQAQVIRLESYKTEIEALGAILNQHARLIEEANSRVNVPAEFEAFRGSIQKTLKQIDNVIMTHSITIEALQAQSRSCDSFMDRIQKDLSHIHNLINDVFQRLEDNKSLIKNDQDKLHKSFSEFFANYRKEVNARLDAVVIQLQQVPQSIVDKNDKLLKEHEIVLADNRNMLSKIENMELNIKILDRKIEGFGIQVKKLQLNQQAVS